MNVIDFGTRKITYNHFSDIVPGGAKLAVNGLCDIVNFHLFPFLTADTRRRPQTDKRSAAVHERSRIINHLFGL